MFNLAVHFGITPDITVCCSYHLLLSAVIIKTGVKQDY